MDVVWHRSLAGVITHPPSASQRNETCVVRMSLTFRPRISANGVSSYRDRRRGKPSSMQREWDEAIRARSKIIANSTSSDDRSFEWDEQGRESSRSGPAVGQRQIVRPRREAYDYAPPSRGNGSSPSGGPPNGPSRRPPDDSGGGDGGEGISNITKAFVAGAFILGMGAGIWFDSEVTFEPTNVASTVLVDTKTPNSELCMANGYSSMVFDQRIFVSFNPFNVYVAQPEVKPGCVLRRANFNVLESRGLVDGQQVQACKRNMNTFAFVGDLEGRPQVSCVYHSEEAENQFLRNRPRDGRSLQGDSSGSTASSSPSLDSGSIELGSR
jgi:hypothetical protein